MTGGGSQARSAVADRMSVIVHDDMKFIITDSPAEINLNNYVEVRAVTVRRNAVEPNKSNRNLHGTMFGTLCGSASRRIGSSRLSRLAFKYTYGYSLFFVDFWRTSIAASLCPTTTTHRSAPLSQDLPFKDGAPPPDEVIRNFLRITDECLAVDPTASSPSGSFNSPSGAAPASSSHSASSSSSFSSSSSSSSTSNRPAIAVHCVAGLGRAPVLVAVGLIELGMKGLDAVEFIRKQRKSAFNSRQIEFVTNYKKRPPKSKFRESFTKMFK